MAQLTPTPQVDEAPVALERKNRTWLWILVGVVLVAAKAMAATRTTPTMIHSQVRLLRSSATGASSTCGVGVS